MFACAPAADCSQDTANNFGGTAVPDGFADGSFAGQSISFLSVNLGFFQAFHNFVGVRDNFRQTYADLLSLGRLIQGHSIDGRSARRSTTATSSTSAIRWAASWAPASCPSTPTSRPRC